MAEHPCYRIHLNHRPFIRAGSDGLSLIWRAICSSGEFLGTLPRATNDSVADRGSPGVPADAQGHCLRARKRLSNATSPPRRKA